MNIEILKENGIDYEKGLDRCMDDRQFFEDLLMMFVEDDTFQRTKAACEKKNYDELFKCAHELKGVCGNTALVELFEDVCPLVELLRDGKTTSDSDAVIDEMFVKISASYTKVVNGILTARNN